MHRPDRRASPYRPETGPVTISVEKFEALLPQALNRATGAKPKQDIFFLIRTHLLPLRNNNLEQAVHVAIPRLAFSALFWCFLAEGQL